MKKIIWLLVILTLPCLAQAQSVDDLDSLLSDIEALTETQTPLLESEAPQNKATYQRSKPLRQPEWRTPNFKSRWGQRQQTFKALKNSIGASKKLKSSTSAQAKTVTRTYGRPAMSRAYNINRKAKATYNRTSGATSAKARLLQRQSGKIENLKHRRAQRVSRFALQPSTTTSVRKVE